MHMLTRKDDEKNHKFFWQDVIVNLTESEGLRLAEYLISRVNHKNIEYRSHTINFDHGGKTTKLTIYMEI